ncbi:FadR/GntR family transcriptional regulator [Paracoccus sp. JM45]|uniref:FadR/GntR family transcriptional regulator n=1 Tax=Paracoccus sp. JM45 TaxID=2283626 RepID=UPI000E6BF7BC|nr:FadR/GntR family transcriptional regulator [Paracoccus sp. JM45]RJE81310.1 FadR family transcriptional regulator [Paracoccus sp. JM45]
MPFTKIDAAKISGAVIRQLETLILQGILRPGERLPGERDLAERMGVSRPSLREALSAMQDDGLLVTRPGAGVFVAEVMGGAFSPALVRLIGRHPQAAVDYLTFRKDLEGLAAERAATAAGETDLAVLDRIIADMRHAHDGSDPDTDASLDADFHMAIVEASHNIIALHMMRAMQDLLRQGMLFNRAKVFETPKLRDQLLDQHIAINTALQKRDGPAARSALEVHLDCVAIALADQRRIEGQDILAKLRLQNRE